MVPIFWIHFKRFMQLLTDWCPEGVCVYVLKRKVWQKYVFVSFLQIQNFFNIWVRRQKCETRQKHFHQSSLNAAVLTHDGGRVFCIKRRMFQLLLSASHYQKHNPTSWPQRNRIIPLKKYWFLNFSKLVGIIIICLYKSCKRLQPVQFCHLQQHLFRFLLQIVSFSCAFYFTKITRAVFHFLTPFSCSYLNLTVASMYACEL